MNLVKLLHSIRVDLSGLLNMSSQQHDSSSDLKAKLQKFVSSFKEKIITFLLSSDKKILILETPDVITGATRALQVLDQLQTASGDQVLKNYAESSRNRFLKWSEFSEIYDKPGEVDITPNLLIVLFTNANEINQKSTMILSNFFKKHLSNTLKKIVILTSRRNYSLCERMNDIPNSAIMKIDELHIKNKIDMDNKDDSFPNILAPTWFSNAVSRGDLEEVSELISQGIDVNCIVEEKTSNGVSNRYSALYVAAREGYSSIVEVLMNHGANFTLEDKFNRTSLPVAPKNVRLDVEKRFLKFNKRVNVCGKDTPLHIATRNNHVDVVKCFLKFKDRINIDKRNNDGDTALRLAAVQGRKEIFSILLEANANPNSFNNFGWTVLHGAAANNHIEIVDELLRSGRSVDINVRNITGSTALMEAVWFGHTDVVNKLLEYGADSDGRNNNGKTALHLAAELDHVDAVRMLLEKGANARLKDNADQTALDLAKSEPVKDMLRLHNYINR